jgi:hypothetical protein
MEVDTVIWFWVGTHDEYARFSDNDSALFFGRVSVTLGGIMNMECSSETQNKPAAASVPPAGRYGRLNSFLECRRALILIILLAAAIFLRVVYYNEISASPCFWLHRYDQSDMHFFNLWGTTVAKGNWLTDASLHPYYHTWYQDIADRYYSLYPQKRAEFGLPGKPTEPQRLAATARIWDIWYGGRQFHQEPLYPYLLAITYRLFSFDIRAVFVWQLLLGAASVLLVYLIARKAFDDLTAVISGLLALLCGPLLFFDMVLLRPTLLTFVGLASVFLVMRAAESERPMRWLAAGLMLGVSFLAKTIFVLMVGFVAIFLLWSNRRSPARLLRSLLPLAGGFLLCLCPVVARNVKVGAPPFSFTSANSFTFVASNSEDYQPEVGFMISRHTVPILAETDGRFLPSVIKTLKTHSSPISYLKLAWRKFAAIWHWHEQPNNANFYYYRLHSAVLRDLPVTFLVIAPLALLGILLALAKWRTAWPLLLYSAAMVGVMLLSLALARYRAPLLAAVIPFAGYSIAVLVSRIFDRQFAQTGAILVAGAVLALWTSRPLPSNVKLIDCYDYSSAYVAYYSPLATAAIQRNDWPYVVSLLTDSLKIEPRTVKAIAEGGPSPDDYTAGLASFFWQVHSRLAEALRSTGRIADANAEDQRAERLENAGR